MLDYSLIKGDYQVTWEDIGEGLSGDYDPDDPNDVALLRFTVSKWNREGFAPMDDGSYCTNVPASTSRTDLLKLSFIIMERVEGQENVKKICEELSWISPEWLDKR